MFLLKRPTAETITRFLTDQAGRDYTYPAVGATGKSPPRGFWVNHSRIKLGEGEAVFAAAQTALRQWSQFRLGWLEALPDDTPLEPGRPVAILARIFFVRWLNACRIIQVLDESKPVHRFGFAYGTLPDHAARGEERFLIEWNPAEDDVWFDICSFSRPHHALTWLTYPWMRILQKRFCREATTAMLNAVLAKVGGNRTAHDSLGT